MRQFACLLVFLSAVAAASAQEVRTWTDSQGRKMQAQLVREVDGDVTFIKDGKLITFPLDQLSEADQKFIREAETEKKVEEKARPAGAPAKEAGPDSLVPPLDSSQPGDAKASLTKQRTSAEERTWRDVRGKQTVGKFVRMHDGNVVLLRGGRVVSIPFASLSQADRDYLRELLTARGESAQLPSELSEAPPVLVQAPPPVEGPANPGANAPVPRSEPPQPDAPPTTSPERNPPADDRVASRSIPQPSGPGSNHAREMTDRLRSQAREGFPSEPTGVRIQRQINWVAVLIGGAFGAVIGSLIGALILRAAAHWALGHDVAYGDAFVAMFVANLINFALGLGLGFSYGVVNGSDEGAKYLSLITLPLTFLVQAGVISNKLDTDFGAACKVTLTMYAISFAIILVICFPIFLLLRSAS